MKNAAWILDMVDGNTLLETGGQYVDIVPTVTRELIFNNPQIPLSMSMSEVRCPSLGSVMIICNVIPDCR